MSKSGPAGDGIATPQPIPSAPSHAALNRRQLLAGSAALLPLVNVSCSTPAAPPSPTLFTMDERALLDAFADRIIPADQSGPGAAASGVTRYIERSLGEWNQADLPLLRSGMQALDSAARGQHMQDFASLTAEQQDDLMLAMEAGRLAGADNAQAAFNRMHRLVLEGMFSDPYYGGNANYGGWDLIGYPGAVLGSTAEMQQMGGRLPMLHTSAYGAEHDGDHDGERVQHDGH